MYLTLFHVHELHERSDVSLLVDAFDSLEQKNLKFHGWTDLLSSFHIFTFSLFSPTFLLLFEVSFLLTVSHFLFSFLLNFSPFLFQFDLFSQYPIFSYFLFFFFFHFLLSLSSVIFCSQFLLFCFHFAHSFLTSSSHFLL